LFDFLIGYPKRTTGFWGKNLLDIQWEEVNQKIIDPGT
jgi:hypothetical protein